MRKCFIVTYDISDPKRLRKVFKVMEGYGDWLQLSVFRCELSRRDLGHLMHRLSGIIDHHQDQVLIIDIGPAPGRSDIAVKSIGLPYRPRSRAPVVV